VSRRDHVEARCPACMMYRELCVCAAIPTLVTRTRLVLLIHYREARKPTNTGQLAARCMPNSEVGIIGDRGRPELPAIGEDALLLYPADDAIPIAQAIAANPDRPRTLIVPDGNWRQAAKMAKRVPGVASAQHVTLDGVEAAPTEYGLRREPKDGGLATLEAIARALRILEGEHGASVEEAMLAVFRLMVSRTKWLRGLLADDDVIGGLPVGARR
jgi:DTW domain-containing protein YfiP